MTKLFLIMLAVVALAKAADRSDPPLLIDGAQPAQPALDASN